MRLLLACALLACALPPGVRGHGVHPLERREPCSRARSRLARGAMERLVLPVLESTRAEVSPQCPWRVGMDVYAAQEAKKERVHDHHWQCGVCSKAFLSEDALDKHLGARHAGLARPEADVCLADFCDVLQCDVYEASTRGVVSLAHPLPVAARQCGARELEAAKHKCDSLLRLCLPLHGRGTGSNATRGAARQAAAYDRLVASHCGMLTCDHVHDLFASAVFAARLWAGLVRAVTVIVTLVVVVYYIGVARDVISTALQGGGGGTGLAKGGAKRGAGFAGLLPKEELPRRVAAFLLGGKLGVRLAFGQLLWTLGQRYWRRLQKQQRKKRA